MRLLRGPGLATVLLNLLAGSPVAGQSAVDTPQPESLTAPASDEDEIIVQGRRKSERYRIPPELRTLPKERDMRAQSFDPRLACQAVGPRGCGPPLMTIVTVTADGKVRIGSLKEE